jgi:hypothetical protein
MEIKRLYRVLSVHLGQRKIIQDEQSEEKRDEPETETRFANIPRLCSFADELRYVNVRSISTDSHTDTGRDQIDGHSNRRGRRDRNGRPHSSNPDSNIDAFSVPDSGEHSHDYADLYFSITDINTHTRAHRR